MTAKRLPFAIPCVFILLHHKFCDRPADRKAVRQLPVLDRAAEATCGPTQESPRGPELHPYPHHFTAATQARSIFSLFASQLTLRSERPAMANTMDALTSLPIAQAIPSLAVAQKNLGVPAARGPLRNIFTDFTGFYKTLALTAVNDICSRASPAPVAESIIKPADHDDTDNTDAALPPIDSHVDDALIAEETTGAPIQDHDDHAASETDIQEAITEPADLTSAETESTTIESSILTSDDLATSDIQETGTESMDIPTAETDSITVQDDDHLATPDTTDIVTEPTEILTTETAPTTVEPSPQDNDDLVSSDTQETITEATELPSTETALTEVEPSIPSHEDAIAPVIIEATTEPVESFCTETEPTPVELPILNDNDLAASEVQDTTTEPAEDFSTETDLTTVDTTTEPAEDFSTEADLTTVEPSIQDHDHLTTEAQDAITESVESLSAGIKSTVAETQTIKDESLINNMESDEDLSTTPEDALTSGESDAGESDAESTGSSLAEATTNSLVLCDFATVEYPVIHEADIDPVAASVIDEVKAPLYKWEVVIMHHPPACPHLVDDEKSEKDNLQECLSHPEYDKIVIQNLRLKAAARQLTLYGPIAGITNDPRKTTGLNFDNKPAAQLPPVNTSNKTTIEQPEAAKPVSQESASIATINKIEPNHTHSRIPSTSSTSSTSSGDPIFDVVPSTATPTSQDVKVASNTSAVGQEGECTE
jgi:hypothetical protein